MQYQVPTVETLESHLYSNLHLLLHLGAACHLCPCYLSGTLPHTKATRQDRLNQPPLLTTSLLVAASFKLPLGLPSLSPSLPPLLYYPIHPIPILLSSSFLLSLFFCSKQQVKQHHPLSTRLRSCRFSSARAALSPSPSLSCPVSCPVSSPGLNYRFNERLRPCYCCATSPSSGYWSHVRR